LGFYNINNDNNNNNNNNNNIDIKDNNTYYLRGVRTAEMSS